MSYFVFYCYLFISSSGSITSDRGERSFVYYRLIVIIIMWFLFGELSPSSWCLGKAALFYCGTPWAFHIFILKHSTDICSFVTPTECFYTQAIMDQMPNWYMYMPASIGFYRLFDS